MTYGCLTLCIGFPASSSQACWCSCPRYGLRTPEIIFPNHNTFSLLEDSPVQLHNRECPQMIKSLGILHPGGLYLKKTTTSLSNCDPLAFALIVSTRASVFSNSEQLRKPFSGHVSEELTHVRVRLGEL